MVLKWAQLGPIVELLGLILEPLLVSTQIPQGFLIGQPWTQPGTLVVPLGSVLDWS